MNKENFVLVVEDEALLLVAIQKKLKLSGIESVGATTGNQAIDYLGTLDVLPTVIWLDYYLPDTNGLEFLSTIKMNEKWKDIPVVVVSNFASPDKVHSMLSLGADKYLLKSSHKLEEIISEVLKIAI